jgi:hypothetical protein
MRAARNGVRVLSVGHVLKPELGCRLSRAMYAPHHLDCHALKQRIVRPIAFERRTRIGGHEFEEAGRVRASYARCGFDRSSIPQHSQR